MNVLISQEYLSGWLSERKLLLSVSFEERKYLAQLCRRQPDGSAAAVCVGKAADYEVAVIGAVKRYERAESRLSES